MQASRLLSILMLLQTRGRATAAELAQATEVSQRTILRDIDQLSAAGVPLWGERGRGGGFRLQPGWSTQLTGMTEAEANALLLAGLPGPATELGLGTAAASARLKMVASLPGAWREQAARVGERLHIDAVDWYRAGDSPRFLREAAEAVWRGRRVAVRYESWRGASRRELEPLGLVLKAGAWYLVAAESGRASPRIYRVASLLALDPLAATFKRPRAFDLARVWSELAAGFEQALLKVPVTLHVSPRAMAWLANARLPATAMPAAAGQRAQAGWQTVAMQVESIEHGARRLLAFGAEVEVVSPPALRDELAALAGRVQSLYAKRARPRVRRPSA